LLQIANKLGLSKKKKKILARQGLPGVSLKGQQNIQRYLWMMASSFDG
jgi:hypothetical protein